MTFRSLGKIYEAGSVLMREGDLGESMFVIQEGEVEILVEREGRQHRLGSAGPGEVIGEMALFDKSARSATVRALGRVRALTLDRRTFITRVHEDPSLAYHILQVMTQRVRELIEEVASLKARIDERASAPGGGAPAPRKSRAPAASRVAHSVSGCRTDPTRPL